VRKRGPAAAGFALPGPGRSKMPAMSTGTGGEESERRLAQAAARSPQLAGMLAGRRDDPGPRYRRLGYLLGALVLMLIALAYAVWAISPRRAERPHETAEVDTSHYLRPIETSADPATGEETAPFSGFAVSIETDPPEALVTVAGVPRGEAPVLASVDCKAGAKVAISAEKAGRPPATASTVCRPDTLVKLTVRLGP